MTINFRKRFSQHLCCIKKRTHGNDYLQNAFHKYGYENFVFDQLQVVNRLPQEKLRCFRMRLAKVEYSHIVRLGSASPKYGYNLQIDPRWVAREREIKIAETYSFKKSGDLDARYGENNCQTKLTKLQVKEIRILLTLGTTASNVAKYFKVSNSLVRQIQAGFIWKNIQPTTNEIAQYSLPDFSTYVGRSIDVSEVKKIKYLLLKGFSISAVDCFLNQTRAGNISRGKTYTDVELTTIDIENLETTDLLGQIKEFNESRLYAGRKASNEAGAKSARSRFSKITAEDSLEVKSLIIQGLSTSEIANKLEKVSVHMIHKIRTGRIWHHVTGIKKGDFIPKNETRFGAGENFPGAKLKEDDVRTIKHELRKGVRVCETS